MGSEVEDFIEDPGGYVEDATKSAVDHTTQFVEDGFKLMLDPLDLLSDANKSIKKMINPDMPKIDIPRPDTVQITDPAIKAYRDRAKKLASQGGAQKSTIHTSSLGDTSQALTTNKSLLGQ